MNPSQITRQINLASDIAKPGIIPIMANIVIGSGAVKASDIDSQLTIKAPLDFDPYTVPAAKFKGILATLADVPMTLANKNGKLSIKSGRSKFTCPTLPVESFPKFETGDVISQITMPQESLKTMLQKVQHAIPTNNVRMMLNGALLDFSGTELSVVGCDGNRMAWTSMPMESQKQEAIIPHKSVSRIIKLMDYGDVTLSFYDGKVGFATNEMEYITKLVPGKYPDWRRIIPKNPHQVQIDIELFKEAISRASIVLDKVRSARIKLTDVLSIECTNNGESASDDFPVQWPYEAYAVGMNPDYVRDALSVMDGDEVTLNIGAGSAWLMECDGVKTVIMPLRN